MICFNVNIKPLPLRKYLIEFYRIMACFSIELWLGFLQNLYRKPFKISIENLIKSLQKTLQNPYRTLYKIPIERFIKSLQNALQNPYRTLYRISIERFIESLQNALQNPCRMFYRIPIERFIESLQNTLQIPYRTVYRIPIENLIESLENLFRTFWIFIQTFYQNFYRVFSTSSIQFAIKAIASIKFYIFS